MVDLVHDGNWGRIRSKPGALRSMEKFLCSMYVEAGLAFIRATYYVSNKRDYPEVRGFGAALCFFT